jgi:uncharacterized protein (TIGR02246 family)
MLNSRKFSGYAVALAAVLAFACLPARAQSHDADVKALKENEAQWNHDFAARDLDKIVAHYADDGVLIVCGALPSSGKDAIRQAFTGMVADPAFSLKFQASKVEVAKSGDLAFTQGAYTLTLTEPATKKSIQDHGSYVTTYRKQGGMWKAVADVALSEIPPPAQK